MSRVGRDDRWLKRSCRVMTKNNAESLYRGRPLWLWLYALRAHHGWSQIDLANALGTAVATIVRWESGRNAPQRSRLRLIEKMLTDAGISEVDESVIAGMRRKKNTQRSA